MKNAANIHLVTYTRVLGSPPLGLCHPHARSKCGQKPQINPGAHRHLPTQPSGEGTAWQGPQGACRHLLHPLEGEQSLWKNIPERQATTFPDGPVNTQIPQP